MLGRALEVCRVEGGRKLPGAPVPGTDYPRNAYGRRPTAPNKPNFGTVPRKANCFWGKEL